MIYIVHGYPTRVNADRQELREYPFITRAIECENDEVLSRICAARFGYTEVARIDSTIPEEYGGVGSKRWSGSDLEPNWSIVRRCAS